MKLDTILVNLKELEKNGGYRFHLAKTSWEKINEDTLPEDDKKEKWIAHCPLQAIAKGDENWKGWQTWKQYQKEQNKWKDRFPAKYIVSFAQISGDKFLFGGIFEIKERYETQYDVELKEWNNDLIGRLVIEYEGGTKRITAFRPERLSNIKITEIYPARYTGEIFKSVSLINHDYSVLETIFIKELQDWKIALSKVKGIYLLTDKLTGKHYIGSASGEDGIWGRWSQYISNFTGGNKELMILIEEKGEDYFKNHFKFSVLETVGSSLTKDEIIQREQLWKEKLFTRKFGYNSN